MLKQLPLIPVYEINAGTWLHHKQNGWNEWLKHGGGEGGGGGHTTPWLKPMKV